MSDAKLDNIRWLSRWKRIVEPAIASRREEEVRRETNPRHVLFQCRYRAVALNDSGDVLLVVEGRPERLAIVHLTYSGRPDLHDDFPWTVFFPDVETFVQDGMTPDHETGNV